MKIYSVLAIGVIIVALVVIGTYGVEKSKSNQVIPTPSVSAEESMMTEITPTITELPIKPTKTVNTSKPLINCLGPDGKYSKVTQEDCDKLNEFWKNNKTDSSTSNTSNNSSNSSNSSNSTNSQPSPTLTPTPTPSSGMSVSQTSVTVTLSRSNAEPGSSLVYGSGFTFTSYGATGFSMYNNQSTQGQGFELSSGGISKGQTMTNRTFINSNKPNGTYTGSETLRYDEGGTQHIGPTIFYSITLVD